MNNMKTQKRKGLLIVRRLVTLLFISCVLTACSFDAGDKSDNELLYGFEVQDATDAFYVNDFANIFTDEQKEEIISKAAQLDEESEGIQVVITTVEFLKDTVTQWSEGYEPENLDIYDIAFQMYEQYGIGKDDMGILILFSKGDIDAYLATGYQMQAYITDADAMRIMYTYGKEEFDNDQFAEWLIALQDGVIKEIRELVPIDTKRNETTEEMTNQVTVKAEDKEERGTNYMQIILGFGIIFLVVVFLLLLKHMQLKIKALNSAHKSETNELKEEYHNALRAKADQYQQEIASKDSRFESLKKENESILREHEKMKNQLAEINNFLARVRVLYPNIKTEVHQMIEDEFKASASKVDKVMKECLKLPADKDNISAFKEAIDGYNVTEPDVRRYITEDIDKLSSLYAESCALKEEYERQEREKQDHAIAYQTCEEIRKVFQRNCVAGYENYESLLNAYKKYTSLNAAQREIFPDMQMLSDLESLLRESEIDYQNFNAAHEAERKAKSIVMGIHHADEDDRDKLKKANKYYKELSPAQQDYFSHELLMEIKRLKDEADKDYEIQEECRERDRRRREEELRRREEEDRRHHAQAHISSGLSSTFSGTSHNGGSNNHRAGGSSSRQSVSHKSSIASTPIKHVGRPSGTSTHRSVNSGHGGKPSGGGARMSRK